MRNLFTKIGLFILIGILFSGCNALKRVPKGKLLLIKNSIIIDNKETNNSSISNLLYQVPNSSLLGFKYGLNLYNLAIQNADSVYKAKFINNPQKYYRQKKLLSAKQVARKGKSFLNYGIHNFLKKSGEAPEIFDKQKTIKSIANLKQYFLNEGYFDAKISFKTDTIAPQKMSVTYKIQKGSITTIDSIAIIIDSPELQTIYNSNNHKTFLKVGQPYQGNNFASEIDRLTYDFRNNGVKEFDASNIKFEIDSIAKNNTASVVLKIENQSSISGDSTISKPFKVFKISKVNIFTDSKSNLKQIKYSDSSGYNDFNFFSFKKLKYRKKAITNGIFLVPGSIYSDINHNLTSRYFSNLKVFKSTSIFYTVDKKDTLNSSLIANIALLPRDKFSLNPSLSLTRSNIQDFGISATLGFGIRNIFNGAESFEIAARANLGSSKDLANPNNLFFNISEYGIDTKLSFPSILLPCNFNRIIPKRMIGSTVINLGFAKQQNIGLDKENFTGAMSYLWTPKRNSTARFDLFNVQYVNNINTANYFNVYNSSYKTLNALGKLYNTNNDYFDNTIDRNLTIKDGGSNRFIDDVLSNLITVPADDFRIISSIEERRRRLIENNLILASSFTFFESTSTGISDQNFYTFKSKIESAGNVLSLFANASKNLNGQNSKNTIFDVEYSQYFKTEFEYVKYFDFANQRTLAFRSFFGLAIPYGNSKNIPFSRSYFAGGSNDIRAWQPYSLGPGRSGGTNDFNEANMKILLNVELRFKIFNDLKGALFVDAGNIWNVLDNVTDKAFIFENFNSLKDMAIGSGFGFRYDFGFILIRSDFGFKTYNPAEQTNNRWFRDYNFANSVLNIGINYPF